VGYVEVEQFELAKDVEDDEFARRDAALQSWSYVHRPGLVRRTTARGEGRAVLVVTLFGGGEPPRPLEAGPGDGPLAAFHAVVATSTYWRAVYRDLDG
jgi:hypothetical protein